MKSDQHIWRVWASVLQRLGVLDLSISVLETTGPLIIVAAQVVYFCQPLIRWLVSPEQSQALAEMLEEPARTKEFTNMLKEDFR